MNKMKKFFTFTRRANGGFTLVELIVVIAILAILAGVGIPVYSGYITKANKQADITLVSEVKQAIELGFYSGKITEAGYVILKPNGSSVSASGSEGISESMQDMFGEGWQTNLSLKADCWTDRDVAKIVSESTYLQTGEGVSTLLDSVTALTDIVSSAMGGTDVIEALKPLGVVDQDFATMLTDNGITPGMDGYNEAVANMMVLYVADEISKPDFDPAGVYESDSDMPYLVKWAMQYAVVYAVDNEKVIEAGGLNDQLTAAANAGNANAIKNKLESEVFEASQSAAYFEALKKTDMQAFIEIMKSAAGLSDSILAAGDVTSKDMWVSDGVANTVNGYFNAMGDISELGSGDSAIIIYVFPDNPEKLVDFSDSELGELLNN